MIRTVDTLLAGAGFILWSACFISLYGLHAIACTAPTLGLPAFDQQAIMRMLLVLWALFIGTHMGTIAASVRRSRSALGERTFVLRVAVWLNVAGFAATLFIGAPLLALPACR